MDFVRQIALDPPAHLLFESIGVGIGIGIAVEIGNREPLAIAKSIPIPIPTEHFKLLCQSTTYTPADSYKSRLAQTRQLLI
jgi:hypothetical protein